MFGDFNENEVTNDELLNQLYEPKDQYLEDMNDIRRQLKTCNYQEDDIIVEVHTASSRTAWIYKDSYLRPLFLRNCNQNWLNQAIADHIKVPKISSSCLKSKQRYVCPPRSCSTKDYLKFNDLPKTPQNLPAGVVDTYNCRTGFEFVGRGHSVAYNTIDLAEKSVITFMAWVRLNNFNEDVTLFSYGSQCGFTIQLRVRSFQDILVRGVGSKNTKANSSKIFTNDYINTWFHVGIVKYVDKIAFYFNGTLVGLRTFNGILSTCKSSLVVGHNMDGFVKNIQLFTKGEAKDTKYVRGVYNLKQECFQEPYTNWIQVSRTGPTPVWEPNNAMSGTEACVEMFATNPKHPNLYYDAEPLKFNEGTCHATTCVHGQWNDRPCSSLRPFVCERVGPNCSNGWDHYGRHCYKYVQKALTWHEAQSVCKNQQAILATPSTKNKQLHIQKYLGRHGVDHGELGNIWIGLYETTEGTFIWEDHQQTSPTDCHENATIVCSDVVVPPHQQLKEFYQRKLTENSTVTFADITVCNTAHCSKCFESKLCTDVPVPAGKRLIDFNHPAVCANAQCTNCFADKQCNHQSIPPGKRLKDNAGVCTNSQCTNCFEYKQCPDQVLSVGKLRKDNAGVCTDAQCTNCFEHRTCSSIPVPSGEFFRPGKGRQTSCTSRACMEAKTRTKFALALSEHCFMSKPCSQARLPSPWYKRRANVSACSSIHCDNCFEKLKEWTCAAQNNTCHCRGEVKYGTTDGWFNFGRRNVWTDWKKVNGSIECTNKNFGVWASPYLKICICKAANGWVPRRRVAVSNIQDTIKDFNEY